jgi:hypothetical protein
MKTGIQMTWHKRHQGHEIKPEEKAVEVSRLYPYKQDKLHTYVLWQYQASKRLLQIRISVSYAVAMVVAQSYMP